MRFFCDYALIDPCTLLARIESISDDIYAVDYDIDENVFEVVVDTFDNPLSSEDTDRIYEIVKPYFIVACEA